MLEIKRILCPTDFSAESDAALQYAISLARTYQAKLLICHCREDTSLIDVAAHEGFERRIESAVHQWAGVGQCTPGDYEGILVDGDPSRLIPELASQYCADLIVMRSRRRPVAAALLGSTAEAVCRMAPCPVLITHPNEREWVGKTTCEIDLRRVVVATDFSIDSELALRFGLSVAQEFQTELHLLHVLPVTIASAAVKIPTQVEDEFQRAARLLHQAVPEETYLWCKVIHAVKSGQPYREILNYAEETDADLICLGVHGAGFSMRALFGSNTDRVLRQAPCPVLIARPLKPAS
jgi:nucleotide-binding universal stress UspA family protein